jgi:hypothetical protein
MSLSESISPHMILVTTLPQKHLGQSLHLPKKLNPPAFPSYGFHFNLEI